MKEWILRWILSVLPKSVLILLSQWHEYRKGKVVVPPLPKHRTFEPRGINYYDSLRSSSASCPTGVYVPENCFGRLTVYPKRAYTEAEIKSWYEGGTGI